jgi:class 3 adenylate cyclase/tetratricopeptide (TPR) repeat protein
MSKIGMGSSSCPGVVHGDDAGVPRQLDTSRLVVNHRQMEQQTPQGDPSDGDAAPPVATQAPRRHFVTMLFSDLTGSTRLSAALEAEHYAALLAQLSHAYWTIVARHRGLVVRIQGDGMLAVFGHPHPGEDDGRRATEAALELHAAVRALRVDPSSTAAGTLTLHSGIHSGLVLVGEGDAVKGRLELTGVAPNIAARLSAAARPDEVLVSAGTLGPDSGLFVIDSRRTLCLAGAPAPVVALSVMARAEAENRFEARAKRGLSPFVGREKLLESLAAALDESIAGRARTLALVGTAGMGKTRLANHFLDRCQASGIAVVRGYCESYLGAEPLQPFQQMLRSLAPAMPGVSGEAAARHAQEQLARHAPGWHPPAGFVPHALSLSLSTGSAGEPLPPQAVRQGFVSLFAEMASQRPLVMFIDDWQWADDGSHQVLDALTTLQAPVLVLLAARGGLDLALPQAVSATEVSPWTDDESMRTVKRWLPHAHPFLVRDVCSYAGGNPLFLEELCHRAASDAEVQPVVHLHGGEAWLNGLIASRVARLPKAQVELVQSAAVIGHTMPTWLFERVTGSSADDPQVRALAEQDLIFPGEQEGTLRFKHGITRDVVYEGVGLVERTRLHLATAHALAARSSDVATTGAEACEALAYHFDAAGQPQQAAAYAEAAGDRAVFASALDRAKSQYRAALACLNRLDSSPEVVKRWAAIAQRLGLASVFDPSRDELPLFERAVELAQAGGHAAAVARAQYWLGYMHYALGDAPAAIKHLDEAGRHARLSDDKRLGVQIDATMGQALASAGRYREALALLDEAIAIKRHHRSGAGNAVGLTYSLTCKGYALGDQGEFDGAQACFEEALNDTGCDQPEVIGSVRGWYGAVRLWQGRYDEAIQLAGGAWREGERVRSLHLMSMGRAVAACARWRQSGDPQALDELREAVGWLSRRGNALFSSLNHGWLADALAATGDAAGARRHAAQALRRARGSDLLGASLACRTMCLQAARAGQFAKAERWLDAARHWAQLRESRREQAENLLCAAELARAAGRVDEATALLAEADAAFAGLGMRIPPATVAGLRQAA